MTLTNQELNEAIRTAQASYDPNREHIAALRAEQLRRATAKDSTVTASVDPYAGRPEWANYRATDADGMRTWFEEEPTHDHREWLCSVGQYESDISACPNWRETLEKLP